MALLFTEGFDHYGTMHAEQAGKWHDQHFAYKMHLVPGYLGGQAMAGGISPYATPIRRNVLDVAGDIIVGMRWRLDDLSAWGPHRNIARVYDAELDVLYSLRTAPTSRFQIWDDQLDTLVLESTFEIPMTAWNYVEWKAGAGGVALQINGAPAGSAATVLAVPSIFELTAEGSTMYYDDVYIADTSGAVNNDFLGDVRILPLWPTSDVLAEFDRSDVGAAGNFAMVDDEPGPDEDATYNRTLESGKRDLFGVGGSGLDSSLYAVKGVQVIARARKEDSGLRYLRTVMRAAGVDDLGAVKALATSYQYQQHVTQLNPATGLPWTLAEIESAAFGYETVAP